MRAKPQVDAVGEAVRRAGGEKVDHLLDDAGEEDGVGGRSGVVDLGFSLAISLAIFLVKDDQIDVGAVVEFLSAELAEPEDDHSRVFAVGGAGLAEF